MGDEEKESLAPQKHGATFVVTGLQRVLDAAVENSAKRKRRRGDKSTVLIPFSSGNTKTKKPDDIT